MARTTPVNEGYSIINGSVTGSNGSKIDTWIEWKVTGTSVANNTSNVRIILYAQATTSVSTNYDSTENYGWVGYDNGNKNWMSKSGYDFRNKALITFGDHTFTISHNSDGTKTLTIQGGWSTNGHSSYIKDGSVSGQVTLPRIARASTISNVTANLGSQATISITRQSSDFTHTLTYTFGSASGTIVTKTSNTSVSWTPDVSLIAQFGTNDKTKTGTITCTTYSGNTSVGTSTSTLTLTIPNSSLWNASGTFGSALTLTATNACSSGLTYTFAYYNGSSWQSIASTSNKTQSWTPATSLIANVSNASSGSFNIRVITYRGSTAINTATATATLTIPKNTSSAVSGTIGSAVSIPITKAHSNLTSTITYAFGSASGTIATTTTSTSYSWTPPTSLLTQIPNSTSGTGSITITTYNGTASCGSNSYTLTLSAATSVVPTSALNLTMVNNNSTVAGWGIYLQGYSQVQATLTGSGVSGSTIKSMSISGTGLSYSSSYSTTSATLTGTSSVLTTSGTLTYKGNVSDSRNRSATEKSQSISVVAYTQPSVSGVSLARSNSSGTIDTSGTYLKVAFTLNYSSANGHNSASVVLRYKEASASSWTTYGTVTNGANLNLNLDVSKNYQAQFLVSDSLNSNIASAIFNIPSAERVLNVNGSGSGLAIGGFSTDAGKLQVYYPADFEGSTLPTINGGMFVKEAGGYNLWNATKLPFTCDLNDMVTAGIYYTNTGDGFTISNLPPLSVKLGSFNLKVERCMNPMTPSINNNWQGVIQTFYHYDGTIYNRFMWRGSSATSWSYGTWKVLNEQRGGFDNSSAYITDANDMTISGSYWVGSAYVSNLPVGSGWFGTLTTTNPTTNLYKQTFTAYNNGRTWVRSYANSRWYDWAEVCVNVQGTLANTLAINNANPAHTQNVTFSYIRQGFTATVYASFTFDNFTSSNTSTAGTYFFNGRSFEAGLFGKNDGTITAYGNCVIGWGNSYTISRKANESIFIEGLTNATAKGQTAIAQIHLAYIAP